MQAPLVLLTDDDALWRPADEAFRRGLSLGPVERTPTLLFIRHQPWWTPIRGEARYQSIVRMGLQD